MKKTKMLDWTFKATSGMLASLEENRKRADQLQFLRAFHVKFKNRKPENDE